jgi:two-component system nitrogen regulation response regulator GlnG
MGRLRQRLLATARGRPTLLLEGETGTGKSLLARHIVHEATGRNGAFVTLDLATVPPDLMAARLFGVVRGAYTGASVDRPGAFEHAQGGTLFLDEIGNLTSDAQRLLLSVLQERRVTRLGCMRERDVDVKVIAATNENLRELVERGHFRRDLFMRLNPAGILRIPPLRDRREDLQGAVGYMLSVLAQEPELGALLAAYRCKHAIHEAGLGVMLGERPPGDQSRLQVWFPPSSWARMYNHDWPGNLRELKSVLENLLWNSVGAWIDAPAEKRPDLLTVHPWQIVEMLGEQEQAVEKPSGFSVCVMAQPTLNGVSVDLERQLYRQLYLRSGGAFGVMAAQLLGDASLGRKVQLRFNQLGLRVRDLKGLLV